MWSICLTWNGSKSDNTNLYGAIRTEIIQTPWVYRYDPPVVLYVRPGPPNTDNIQYQCQLGFPQAVESITNLGNDITVRNLGGKELNLKSNGTDKLCLNNGHFICRECKTAFERYPLRMAFKVKNNVNRLLFSVWPLLILATSNYYLGVQITNFTNSTRCHYNTFYSLW